MYLINHLSSRFTKNQSPYYYLYQLQPDCSHLRTFGCRFYPFHPPSQKHKLTPNSPPCIFMGYSAAHKGYNCFNPQTSTYIISRHAKFDEFHFPGILLLLPFSSYFCPFFPHLQPSASNSTNTLPTLPQPASKQLLAIHSYYSYFLDNLFYSPICFFTIYVPSYTSDSSQDNSATIGHYKTPTILNLLAPTISSSDNLTFKQASNHDHWRQAIQEEIDVLRQQGTWTLVPLPSPITKVIGPTWKYKTKLCSDDSLNKYKARLVAQGFK